MAHGLELEELRNFLGLHSSFEGLFLGDCVGLSALFSGLVALGRLGGCTLLDGNLLLFLPLLEELHGFEAGDLMDVVGDS